MSRFVRAVVRPPAETFAQGLTEAELGAPDLALALAQHAAYCDALERAGLALLRLPPDPAYPDSTFVEDTAILDARAAILTRPGAPSRAGEVASIAAALRGLGVETIALPGPGHVDGGDVCDAGERCFIGLSGRTDEAGARALAGLLGDLGREATIVDVRPLGPALLHLKSGLSTLGEGRLVVAPALADHPAFAGHERVVVDRAEVYAANCVRVNDRVLVAAGAPRLAEALDRRGLAVELLAMSEFQKMDGGLSCLSLRLPAGALGAA
ncbi:MAG: hypothetical protein R3B09_06975 [Nannocystaceae bacterium]